MYGDSQNIKTICVEEVISATIHIGHQQPPYFMPDKPIFMLDKIQLLIAGIDFSVVKKGI